MGTEQPSFGAYVSFELKNGHLRGKFIPVLGLRGRKANFFQEKAGNPLEKQTAAPLQNPVFTLPVSTIGLFLQAQLLTFKKLYSCDSKTPPFQPFCLTVTLEIPKTLQFQVSPEVSTEEKSTRPNPSHAEFGSLQFQQNWGSAVFFPKSHKASKTGIVLHGAPGTPL